MATFIISLLLHGCCAMTPVQPMKPPIQELLQGSWEGKGPPGAISIEIAGNTLSFYAREGFWYEATFTLPEGPLPQQLHATLTDSAPPKKDIGAVVYALIRVDDATLSLAVDDGSLEPPSSFSAAMSRYHLRRTATANEGSSR